ncbi:MAG: 4Fe-4S binding protein [Clostridia bacterium]|jgi:MinD superfamily P-loop ATPase|nr:4Fe-4S binding protein [Clostridia bacterium]MCI2000503.1 4Fe-4S binding protein [Clostridia bacterium]MCI2014958.1 4Fe-4S binding protein [Clostridia bacterium]
MKQLLVLSGKGGTGKTTVSSAFIELSKCRAFADCDVDAPNLHLIVSQKMPEPVKTDFYGLGKAVIDSSKCIQCGLCEKSCRFDAIKDYTVGIYECEGCGLCAEICPVHAIKMTEYSSGSLKLYKYDDKVFSSAQLKMGSGTSGKLVAAVKNQLVNEATDAELAIIDGSPGIGCPVIASISGVDIVLIVAEPTISGMHDMKRIIDTARNFGTMCAVCINKFDVNTENAIEIEKYCKDINVPVIGKIPFDETVVKAVNSCKSIACYPDSPAGKAIKSIWNNIYENFFCESAN